MKHTPFEGEEKRTDIVGPAVPTEVSSSHRLTNELASQWEKDAKLLAQYGSPQQAELLRDCSKKLFETIKREQEVLLTLAVAAQLCGYTSDHLGKLIKAGKLPNHGRKGSPKVRLGDLPKKARAVVTGNSTMYDAVADARSILSRGRRVSS